MLPWPHDLPDPPVVPLAWHGGWKDGCLRVLDQTRLPRSEEWVDLHDDRDVIDAIQRLVVRGAPLLGIVGAYGVALAARRLWRRHPSVDRPTFMEHLVSAVGPLASARPTAVNLPQAVVQSLGRGHADPSGPEHICDLLLEHAHDLTEGEAYAADCMARFGAARLETGKTFLTHCNAGSLVTCGLGTALSPFFALHAIGRPVHVFADETRPLLQGMRLTAWELARAGISHEVLPDSAAAGLLASGAVDFVVVGADRITANGDVANKVGTRGVALAAREAGVPFVVIAPRSTVDRVAVDGTEVSIETRPADLAFGLRDGVMPEGVAVHAPAFDITPAAWVTAWVHEAGVVETPTAARVAAAMQEGVPS